MCSVHFEDSDFVQESEDSNPWRPRQEPLKVKRLKKEAVPSKFPGLPAYLSTSNPEPRGEASTRDAVKSCY